VLFSNLVDGLTTSRLNFLKKSDLLGFVSAAARLEFFVTFLWSSSSSIGLINIEGLSFKRLCGLVFIYHHCKIHLDDHLPHNRKHFPFAPPQHICSFYLSAVSAFQRLTSFHFCQSVSSWIVVDLKSKIIKKFALLLPTL
jgi:hypothetical protein